MRKFILVLMAVTAAGAASLATSAPAAAQEYPWCVQGRGVGYPGECMQINAIKSSGVGTGPVRHLHRQRDALYFAVQS